MKMGMYPFSVLFKQTLLLGNNTRWIKNKASDSSFFFKKKKGKNEVKLFKKNTKSNIHCLLNGGKMLMPEVGKLDSRTWIKLASMFVICSLWKTTMPILPLI